MLSTTKILRVYTSAQLTIIRITAAQKKKITAAIFFSQGFLRKQTGNAIKKEDPPTQI